MINHTYNIITGSQYTFEPIKENRNQRRRQSFKSGIGVNTYVLNKKGKEVDVTDYSKW